MLNQKKKIKAVKLLGLKEAFDYKQELIEEGEGSYKFRATWSNKKS